MNNAAVNNPTSDGRRILRAFSLFFRQLHLCRNKTALPLKAELICLEIAVSVWALFLFAEWSAMCGKCVPKAGVEHTFLR